MNRKPDWLCAVLPGSNCSSAVRLSREKARFARRGMGVFFPNLCGNVTYDRAGKIFGCPIVTRPVCKDSNASPRLLGKVLISIFGSAAARRDGRTGIMRCGIADEAAIYVASERGEAPFEAEVKRVRAFEFEGMFPPVLSRA